MLPACRQRLANVLEAHALRGCAGQPRFAVGSTAFGGVPTLAMSCGACGTLQVVV